MEPSLHHSCIIIPTDPPTITFTDTVVRVTEGGSYTRTIPIDANPPATTSVQIPGQFSIPVPPSISTSGNSLVITNARRGDSGSFLFVATNRLGNDSASFTLNVECKYSDNVAGLPSYIQEVYYCKNPSSVTKKVEKVE